MTSEEIKKKWLIDGSKLDKEAFRSAESAFGSKPLDIGVTSIIEVGAVLYKHGYQQAQKVSEQLIFDCKAEYARGCNDTINKVIELLDKKLYNHIMWGCLYEHQKEVLFKEIRKAMEKGGQE